MVRKATPDQFARDLIEAVTAAPVQARAVVKKGAQNIKTESQANALRSAPTRHAHAPYAITYDEPQMLGARIESEVGYDKDLPGGDLGNILEFGGGGDHSPPHRDIGRAADNEESRLESAVALMAARLL